MSSVEVRKGRGRKGRKHVEGEGRKVEEEEKGRIEGKENIWRMRRAEGFRRWRGKGRLRTGRNGKGGGTLKVESGKVGRGRMRKERGCRR